MRVWPILLLLTAACLSGGCDTGKGSGTSRWTGMEHSLIAEPLFPDRKILDEYYIVQTKNHFILKQYVSDKEFSVYHLKGDSLLYDGEFLTYGRGPFEVLAATVHYIPQHNSVVVAGHNPVGKSFVIPVDTISNLFSHDTWREYDYSKVRPTTAFFTHPIDTVTYVMPFHEDESRMLALLYTGSPSELVPLDVEYPDDGSMPAARLYEKTMYAYGGIQLNSRPWHKERIAYTLGRGHYVAICTSDDNFKVTGKKVVFNEPPEWYIDENGEVRGYGSTKVGLHMSVSENYIYLCDSDMTLEDYASTETQKKKGYPVGYGKTVYVCDWEGNPVAKYELDRAVIRLSPDKNDEYIYAFAFNAETLESDIVRFRLPVLNR